MDERKLHEVILMLKMMIATYEKKATPRCPYKALRYSLGLAVRCVEKQIAKKIVINNIPKTSWTKATTKYTCPSCDRVIGFNGMNYCPTCGQKLDWSEV